MLARKKICFAFQAQKVQGETDKRTMAEKPPVVLTIAGFDPSSGAGVTADIKTIAAHGCYGVACITAMTVQSPHVVLDPILKSSSGADLLDAAGTRVLIERLIPLADVITPNVDEASVLTGLKVTDLDEMRAAAAKLHKMGSVAVVVTGGHLDKAIDLLSFDTGHGVEQEVFKAERQRSNSTHGTGCAFATALACHLALDRGIAEATLLAKTYVTAAIAAGHPLGQSLSLYLSISISISDVCPRVSSAGFQPQTMPSPPEAIRSSTSGSPGTPPDSTLCRKD